jgi:predicted polyphosphate/ATP-dependent NAD kinase
MSRLGLIVNPIAGLGGRVGLKGSDGADVQRQARALGAEAHAGERAAAALSRLQAVTGLEIVTYPGEMGADAARAAGFEPLVIGDIAPGATTAADTRRAAQQMHDLGVDLLLFAGGDGTARDIYQAVGLAQPALGIPAGVKIHSAVYATHPAAAGELAALYLRGRADSLREAEVMDIDEDAFRHGRLSAQ